MGGGQKRKGCRRLESYLAAESAMLEQELVFFFFTKVYLSHQGMFLLSSLNLSLDAF